ncbi:TraC family protein [Escherichia coli]|nr:hypothetical protein [Klebsiella pneumoniae]
MARKTLAERRAAAKEQLKKLDEESAMRIARLAIQRGWVELELTDEENREAIDEIVQKYRERKRS